MTHEECARKANVRRVMLAIIEVSKSISELGVAETEVLACEDPLNVYPATHIGVVVTRLHEVLDALKKVRESLEGERVPIEFSEERLLNNEWMDLDTEIVATMGEPDGPAPNLDERVEVSRKSWEDAFDVFNRKDVERRFAYHPPKAGQLSAFSTIRNAGMEMALTLLGLCPESEERDRAIETIDMAVMWANASIARHWA